MSSAIKFSTEKTISYFCHLQNTENMYRKYLIILLFISLTLNLTAQNRFAIYFTDKNNTPFSIGNPSAYLSQHAIDRRTKQNIAIDSLDIPVNASYVQGVAATGATILNVSKWLNVATIEVADSAMLASVMALPYVVNSLNVGRPDNTNSATLEKRPDKLAITFQQQQKNLTPFKTNTILQYGASFNQVHMLNGDVLHDDGYQGQGMIIAMMDAGFLNADTIAVFDSIWATNRVISTKDFVNPASNIFNEHYHGAACFSILAANSPGVLMGTAPQASYLLLRSEDAPTEYIIEEYNWASAAEYADSIGADVFSTSLGYTTFDNPAHNHSYATLDGNTAPMSIAASIAASRGIVVINSAGNEGNSSWNYISVPADADHILAVGAVDSAENYANFSGKGPTVDGRIKPDVAAQGSGTYFCSPFDGNIYSGSGTSFSGPVVAGLAACLWQKYYNLSAMQIIEAIKQSASIYTNPDSLIGYGIPDFATAATILNAPEILNQHNSMFIFPNPVNSQLNISGIADGTKSYVISDVAGRKLNEGYFEKSIPIASLQAGIYFVTFSVNEFHQTLKFIKN